MMAIRCVLFDFDGVLRNWDYDQANVGVTYGISLDAFRDAAFAPETVVPVIRGEITHEEWVSNIGRILKIRFPDKDVKGALETWSSRAGELVPEVLEIVRECKSKLPVALMSNATSRLNQDLKTLGLDGLFDYVINASEVGFIKPEPEIYLHALKLVGVEPHEAFFTDDLPENVNAAEQLGYVGHVFTTPERLRAALTGAGVL